MTKSTKYDTNLMYFWLRVIIVEKGEGSGEVGEGGSGEVGEWGSGEVGKWGSCLITLSPQNPITPKPYHPISCLLTRRLLTPDPSNKLFQQTLFNLTTPWDR
ncbi:hypothetical protein [Microcystis sp. M60BS1]|uniref:hypothetical protein n=1 Tax=Microcystis sp. M60BS1 TaxID=2771202 RepID=UPI00257A3E1C|nr:hypothetical protein [Microcystis sp. M60BS1]